MDLGLTGKTAIVTAASKGLGRATAHALSNEGARVMISSRSDEQLAQTATEISDATGTEVLYCPADVAKGDDITRLVRDAQERLGGIDLLINNAGGPPAGAFEALDDGAWQEAFELLLLSSVRLIRGVLPSMRSRGGGRIVNVASSSIKQPIENLVLSNTYRLAIVGLAKSLSVELAPDGILINTLGPGRIATERVARLDAGRAESAGITIEEVRELAERGIPVGRYGRPEEFGAVAAFLVSGANTYLTGQAFLVDGGMVRAL